MGNVRQSVRVSEPEHHEDETEEIELPDDDVKIASDSEMLRSASEPERKPTPQPEPEAHTEPEPEPPIVTPVEEKPKEPDAIPVSPAPATPAQPPVLPPVSPTPKPPVNHTGGAYEEGIKQDIIDMLPESEKAFWRNMLAPISDITRGEIDIHELRDDFEECDKDRFTFYVLNDEYNTLWPVMYPDQIIEPLRCVVKWDEEGAAEVFM